MSIFLLENTVNQVLFSFFFLNFSTLLVVYGILTKCAGRVISDCTVLEVQTQERMSLEQTNQWLAPTFQ